MLGTSPVLHVLPAPLPDWHVPLAWPPDMHQHPPIQGNPFRTSYVYPVPSEQQELHPQAELPLRQDSTCVPVWQMAFSVQLPPVQ